jgi:hypothetical protein
MVPLGIIPGIIVPPGKPAPGIIDGTIPGIAIMLPAPVIMPGIAPVIIPGIMPDIMPGIMPGIISASS